MNRLILVLTLALTLPAWAQSTAPQDAPAPDEVTPEGRSMTLARMAGILEALDPDIRTSGAQFQITVEDVPVLIVTDPIADRMRAMVPIRSAAGMSRDELQRLMQANFDSALDARYALAQGRLWAVFIHPLSPLRDDQLISGIGQTVNVALTYGTLFSGGAMQFGGGDSAGEQRKLIERLLKKGQDI